MAAAPAPAAAAAAAAAAAGEVATVTARCYNCSQLATSHIVRRFLCFL